MKRIFGLLLALIVFACSSGGFIKTAEAMPSKESLNTGNLFMGPALMSFSPGIGNDFIAANIGPDGKFNFGLHPSADIDWFNISFAWPSSPWSSFSTVQVDGQNSQFGSNGFVVAPHNIDDLTNESIARFGDISVRQVIQIVENPATGNFDAAEIRYVMTNTGTVPHNAGLRIMIDTMLNGNDSSPFKIPTAEGMVSTNQEQNYLANNVPDFWQGFNNFDNPNISAQWTLRGGDAVAPDRLAIASWSSISGTQWDYATTPGRYTGDSAVGMWWNGQSIPPGQTRTIVTYYGMPRVAGTGTLSISAPSQLPYSEWSNRPFNVVAYFNNRFGRTFSNAFLVLETSMNLMNDDPQHSIGDIVSNGNAQTTWSLQPTAPGSYSVLVKAYELVDGEPQLIDVSQTNVQLLPPPIPENIQLNGTSGTTADGTPVATLSSPLTVHASFDNPQPSRVEIRIFNDYRSISDNMTRDDTGWVYTVIPASLGFSRADYTIQILAFYDDSTGVQQFQIELIDPSGFVYNANQGIDWTLPGATVNLQYYDPLGWWVDMTDEAYQGRMSPVNNPQISDSDGRFGWDVAEGRYRVVVSRNGFNTVTSQEYEIPPAVTDLNIGLTPTDTLPPNITLSGVSDGTNSIGPVAAQITASDNESGIKDIAYSIDNGAEVTVDGENALANVAANGNHTISYRAIDYAGNVASGSVRFSIGAELPEFSWIAPLNTTTATPIELNNNFDIGITGNGTLDKTVTLRIRNAATNALVVGYVYGSGITYANGQYHQLFKPSKYGIQSNTRLKVMMYFGGKLKNTAYLTVN